MSGKDIIKLILILNGYDRNINIETWKDGEDKTVVWYEFSAMNESRDEINIEEPTLTGALYTLFSTLFGNNFNCPIDYIGETVTNLLNDNVRNDIIKRKEQDKIYNNIYDELYKPLEEWCSKNNPCPDCTINDHSYNDPIHYNCELCHTQSCAIMKSFNDEYCEKLKELNKKAKEIFESSIK